MAQMSQAGDLTSGPMLKKIILFSLPLAASSFLQLLFNAADVVVVGRFVGSAALAAVGSNGALINLLVNLFVGLALGANVVAARCYGAKDDQGVHEAVQTAVTLSLVGGVLMAFVGFFAAHGLLELMSSPEDVIDLATLYLKIYFIGMPMTMLYNFNASLLRAVGDTRRPLVCLAVAGVINVVLNLLFVIVFQMSVAGVALATILSQTLSALLAFRKLTHTGHSYRLSWRQVRFHGDMLRQVVYLGIPSGVQNSVISLANVIVQANINAFGSAAMAGCGAYSKIEGFAFLPVSCFSMALATFVSQNIGARRYDRVRSGIRFGLLCSPLLAEAIGLGIFVLSPLLVAAFNSSPEVIAYGVADARTVSLFYFLLAFSHCCAGILRGTGRPIIPMAIMLATWCALRIAYITAVTHFIPDIRVIYWAYPLTWFLGGLLFAVCLLRLRFPSDAALETYK